MIVDVVMRCRNEMPHTPRALDALLAQRNVTPRVFFFDCASTDGSRQEASRRHLPILDVDPSTYIPGVVLNRGMRATTSEIVAFINADAVALDPFALEALIEPLLGATTLAATFGRQEVRPEAGRLTTLDQERAFGVERPVALARGSFFSMAASAITRQAWRLLPFDETLRYSEDVDWTTRIRALGLGVEYRPRARFEHSHDYSLRQHFVRRRGEGAAESQIFRLGQPSWRELVRPLAGSVVRDLRQGAFTSLPTRVAQAVGFYLGRLTPVPRPPRGCLEPGTSRD
ncbi:MAG: glycosyltransferase [Polyangiaceae bacterium]|nr:glycosyltransferase [Polyangiaceae bacterium]